MMSRKPGRQFAACAAALMASAAGGCRTYEPRALDMEGHRDAWLARTPADPAVAAYAQRMAEEGRPVRDGFDLRDGVSLAEAEAVAMVFNPDLRMARLRAGVALATAENAGLWQDPELGVDVQRILESVDEPWKVFTTIGVTIPISGRLELEKKSARTEHALELVEVARAEWETRIALRRAWIEWSALREDAAAAREFVLVAEATTKIVDRLEEAGEIARIEARLFRVELAQRRSELRGIEAQLEQAELEIKAIMGLAPGAPVELRAWGLGESATGSMDELMLAAGERNPRLAAARSAYAAAEAALELEVRKQYPDIMIGPGYGREEGMDQFLFGVSLPLPFVNGNRQAIAEAEAKREEARGAFETEYERLWGEVSKAESRLRAAEAQRRIIEEDVVPLVDAQYADTRKLAELGEVNTFVLLESLAQSLEAKRQLIAARKEESLARAALREIVGPEAGAGAGDAVPAEEETP